MAITPQAVFARETPPSPGLLNYVLGGTTHFNQSSLTWKVYVKDLPPDLAQYFETNPDPEAIDWLNHKIPQGSKVFIQLNVETGRRRIDAKTTVWQSNGFEDGGIILEESSEPSFVVEVPTNRQFYSSRFRIYVKVDGKDLDVVENFELAFESMNAVLARNNISRPPDSASTLPENNNTGRVGVTLRGSPSRVKVYSSGQLVASQEVFRRAVFDGIPAGDIRITVMGSGGWQHTGSPADFKVVTADNGMTYSVKTLSPGGEIEFLLNQGGAH